MEIHQGEQLEAYKDDDKLCAPGAIIIVSVAVDAVTVGLLAFTILRVVLLQRL